MNSFKINPVSLMCTLSMSLDLAVNGVNKHQWRTAALCKHIADAMNIAPDAQSVLLGAAMMHDIGAAPRMDERNMLLDPKSEVILGDSIHDHSHAGYELLGNSNIFGALARPVLHHHEAWSGGNPSGLSGADIPLFSRIIHVSDRIDTLIDKKKPVLLQSESVKKKIRKASGSKFDPDVVDAFMQCARAESFWLDLLNPAYAERFFSQINVWGQNDFTARDVLSIAELFATLIDRMSVFTATHSRSVSEVAVLLAREAGFCENELYMIKIAGLLHDLGKLSVPNSILEKPGKLDEAEMNTMRQHTYYTYRILEQIENLETIAAWAAFHHETLDGQGYPFKLDKSVLPLGSRIMTVADIFVALTEDRPYRAGLPRENVAEIMQGMVERGKIDGKIVECLFDKYADAKNIVASPYESNQLLVTNDN